MSIAEPYLAEIHKTMLMAQVGPPNFYTDGNPYLFGFHINSDMYPQAAVQTLGFYANENLGGSTGLQKQPIKVVYRTKSAFFKSTCESVIRFALEAGFTNITEISYDPFADHDEDGDVNAFDDQFLNDIADQACPLRSEQQDPHPAIFVCSAVEQDQLLKRWKRNGCRPVSLWISASVSGWAYENPGAVPYIQGGAQWHTTFDYSDRYFNTGAELLAYTEMEFDYIGTHNLVAAYSTAVLFSQHIAARYRISNTPTVAEDFASEQGYEILRRDLLVLTTDTLFGPFALNNFKRNVGRGAAASQWLPNTDINASSPFRSKCISPSSQAEAATVIPTPASLSCDAGLFVKPKFIRKEAAILSSKCDVCPVDTFTSEENNDLKCTPCPKGSSTVDQDGATTCMVQELNLVPNPIQAMGYSFVGAVWFTAIHMFLWLIKSRNHPAIRHDNGLLFLTFICFGTIVSSSSILTLVAAEAEEGEDTTAASKACISIPFLYTIGWVLQYASMGTKAYRMFRRSQVPKRHVSHWQMFGLVVAAIMFDMLIVIVWATVKPLEYTRRAIGASVDLETRLINVESIGQCSNSGGVNSWAFAAPLLVLHATLVIVINLCFQGVNKAEDPYNDRRYVGIVSVLIFEILVIGIPILLAVSDSGKGKFIVLSAIVFLNDICVLLFIFLPKIHQVDYADDKPKVELLDQDMDSMFEESIGAFDDQSVVDTRAICRRVIFEEDGTSESRDNGSSSEELKKRGLRDTVETDDLTPPSMEESSDGERAPYFDRDTSTGSSSVGTIQYEVPNSN